MSEIPFIDLESADGRFLIRPIMPYVDPIALAEPPHRHSFHELLWIRRGKGHHRIDDQQLTINPETFYLIGKGRIHYFDEGIDLDGFLIRFTDDFLRGGVDDEAWDYRTTLFSHFAVHHELAIAEDELSTFETLLEQLWHEAQREGFGRDDLLRHLLSALLIRLERSRRRLADQVPDSSASSQLFRAFIEQLETSFRSEHHVTFYAKHLGVTSRQLTGLSRKVTGMTAKQLIRERLMLEARRMLYHTNASVKEIAYALGFRDPSYFAKVFKNEAGVAPRSFQMDD